MPKDRVTYAKILGKSGLGLTADIEGTVYHGVSSINPDLNVGDQEPVGFLIPGSSRQPIILAKPRGSTLEFPPLAQSIPPFFVGSWPISQGNSGLDYGTIQAQTKPDLESGSTGFFVLPDAQVGAPPLGVVFFERPLLTVALYYPAERLSGNLQNRIIAYDVLSGYEAWRIDLGEEYSSPTGQEQVGGLRQEWLGFDAQYGRLWAVGWGTSSARETIYHISATGSLVAQKSLGHRAQQNSIGGGYFLKAWHSRRPPTFRDGADDPLIRCYQTRNGTISQKWTFDPQSLFPENYQLATSSGGAPISTYYPMDGRCPIDLERRQIILSFSGSKKLPNSKSATMIHAHPTGLGGVPMATFAQPDDGRTVDQMEVVCALNLDNGKLKWRRDFSHSATHEVDNDSISAAESFYGATVGGSYGGMSVRTYYPQGSDIGGYAELKTYLGLATQDSLLVSPSVTSIPACSIVEGVPTYDPISVPVLPWVGVDWGGSGPYTSPSTGAFSGPKYDWFAPGHSLLLPLPVDIQLESPPRFEWPLDSDTFKRLDPVGGSRVIDSLGNVWEARVRQKKAILQGGNEIQLSWQGHAESFHEPATPDQCGSWEDKEAYWNAYMMPKIVHSLETKLFKTGPDGSVQDFGGWTIGQESSRANSSLQWEALTSVHQIIPVPEKNRLLIVRDWFGGFEDLGGLENLPYPVIELRKYSDPSNVISRTQFLTELGTYLDETGEDPVTRRTWDQYLDPLCLQMGKGANGSGFWRLWRHLVYNREEEQGYVNEVLASIDDDGNIVVSRKRTALGSVGHLPESSDAVGTTAIAFNRTTCSNKSYLSGNWIIPFKENV